MSNATEATIAIGAVVLDRYDDAGARVLLVERGHAPLAGKWTLPGGRPKAGESLPDAVRRELFEETGLTVDVLTSLSIVRIVAEGFDYAIHEYLAVPTDTARPLRAGDDALGARWATAEEIAASDLSPEARDVIRQALRVVKRFRMKSGNCPKCFHTEVLFVPQIADRDDDDNVRPLSVHVVHWNWKDDEEMGKLQAYICRSCGYTEMYTGDPGRLPIDKIPGARIISGSAETKTPKT